MKSVKIPTMDDYNQFVELLSMAYSSLQELTNDERILASTFVAFDRDIFEIFFRPFLYGQQQNTDSK